MTSKERVEKLRCLITCMKCEVSGKECDNNCPTQYDTGNMGEIIENLEEIAKALEQEPCEDIISREDALMCLTGEIKETDTIETIIARSGRRIRKLPSVKPQEPKTGRWIKHNTGHSAYYDCSRCGCAAPCMETADSFVWKMSKFCPNCGAKMESEVKEHGSN